MNKSPSQSEINLILNKFNLRNFKEVEKLSKELTVKFPNHPFGWKALGIALKQKGNLREALEINLKTLEIDPKDAENHYNIGNTYKELGLPMESVRYYKDALKINSKYFQALNNLGVVHKEIGKLEDSENCYRKAIELNPNYVEAYNNLGVTLKELGKLEESKQNYQKAIELNPNYTEAYNNLGITLRELGNLDESEKIYKKIIDIKPKYFEAYSNLGITLREQGKLEESKLNFETVLKLKPDNAEGYYNLGVVLRDLGRLEESEQNYKKAIEIKPNYVEAYNNLGVTLRELRKLEESDLNYNKAIKLNPEYADAYNNLSFNYLLKKEFKQAYELSEWRWRTNHNTGNEFLTKKPLWNGEKDKTIFVWKEQGIGEEIMFGSILYDLEKISKKLIVNCDQRLIPLFERSFSDKIIYEFDRNKINENDFDFHISMGSLRSFFRKNLENYSVTSKGFLSPNREKKLYLKNKFKLTENDISVGISWSTKSSIQMSSFRNIQLNNLIENLKHPNLKFVNLQYGNISKEIEEVKNKFGINIITFPDFDYKNDVDDLASLISACDVIVSIDNFTVHLAGSLGKETKLLLPYTMDSRWGLDDKFSYIYDSVKIFRQTELKNWDKILNTLKNDIMKNKLKLNKN